MRATHEKAQTELHAKIDQTHGQERARLEQQMKQMREEHEEQLNAKEQDRMKLEQERASLEARQNDAELKAAATEAARPLEQSEKTQLEERLKTAQRDAREAEEVSGAPTC